MFRLYRKILLLLFLPFALVSSPLSEQQVNTHDFVVKQFDEAYQLFSSKRVLKIEDDEQKMRWVNSVLSANPSFSESQKSAIRDLKKDDLARQIQNGFCKKIWNSRNKARKLKDNETFEAGIYGCICELHGIFHSLSRCACNIDRRDGHRDCKANNRATLLTNNDMILRELEKLENLNNMLVNSTLSRFSYVKNGVSDSTKDFWSWCKGTYNNNWYIKWPIRLAPALLCFGSGMDAWRYFSKGDSSLQFLSTIKSLVVPVAQTVPTAVGMGLSYSSMLLCEAGRKEFVKYAIGVAVGALILDTLSTDEVTDYKSIQRIIKFPGNITDLGGRLISPKSVSMALFLGSQLLGDANKVYAVLNSLGINITTEVGALGYGGFSGDKAALYGALFAGAYALLTTKKVKNYWTDKKTEHNLMEKVIRGLSGIFEITTAASLAALAVHYSQTPPQ